MGRRPIPQMIRYLLLAGLIAISFILSSCAPIMQDYHNLKIVTNTYGTVYPNMTCYTYNTHATECDYTLNWSKTW